MSTPSPTQAHAQPYSSSQISTTMEDFCFSIEEGIKLSKRLYFGKDRSSASAPPRPQSTMSRGAHMYTPTSPMVYAVISDPAVVDNPDIPSYQPHVHGRCVPSALIPLQMNKVTLEVESFLEDMVVVKVEGQWRVHCVMGSKSCDCRIAVPMGEQGSILGVEVDIPRKSYRTQLVAMEEQGDGEKHLGIDDGLFLRPDIFLLTIPHVDGGTNLNIKLTWSQKLLSNGGDFSLSVPFSFPEYVTPASKKIPKREKIVLNIHPGDHEVVLRSPSHPLKEQKRLGEKLSFLYEADVLTWSNRDLSFSYSVPDTRISGNVLLRSPLIDDIDQREIFCMQILPGSHQDKKVFARKIVFVIDISSSMQGKPLEDTKSTLCAALAELNPDDCFNIIAFNGQTVPFSSSLKRAKKETVENAIKWVCINFVAGDGTDISLALNKAIEMLSDTRNTLPMIILVTDGSVEDERSICDSVKRRLSDMKQIFPRIHTFGIGLYCNHYFLRMLAMIGRGNYDAAYEKDMIEARLQKLIQRATSTVLANISFDSFSELSNVEVYPTWVPDLSGESPLIISGRYSGTFPQVLKARGVLANMANFEIDLKVQKAKEIPIERILAMQQISACTAQAWLTEDKQLETKVAKLSIQNAIVSEYTLMILSLTETLPKEADSIAKQKKASSKTGSVKGDPQPQQVKVLRNLGIGFGNVKATNENLPPGFEEPKQLEAAEIIVKAASDCCSRMCGFCCCMCCIDVCSKVNNQCAIVLTQLCTALACFGCLECCTSICCGGSDGS